MILLVDGLAAFQRFHHGFYTTLILFVWRLLQSKPGVFQCLLQVAIGGIASH